MIDPDLPPPPSDRGLNCVHPEGWLKLDGMCFKMFEGNPLTWYDAEHACRKEGAHLVSVSDQKVKAVVHYLGTEINQPFFIGLRYDVSVFHKYFIDYFCVWCNFELNLK